MLSACCPLALQVDTASRWSTLEHAPIGLLPEEKEILMGIHLVTGGTGFVGAALILELLQQTDADILCLVRPEKGDIDTRLYQSLRNAAVAYGYDRRIMALAQKRCSALTGNLNASLCGYAPTSTLGAVEQFWHCAASLKYEPEHQREIYETNVYGTQRALELARRLHVQSFNYISTAYVAGKRSGLVREELLEGHATNNMYEDSKLAAEHAVAAITEFHARIFRPSIVVGHSQTCAVSGSFTGFYALMQNVSKLGVLSRLQMGASTAPTLHLCVDPTCPMNVIPVDAVAQQIVRIALSSSNASIFHITNSTPPPLRMLLSPIFRAGGVKEHVFVSSKNDFTALDHLLDLAMDFFSAYTTGAKLFDRSQSNAALGDDRAGDFPVDEAMIENYIRWYLPILLSQTMPFSAI